MLTISPYEVIPGSMPKSFFLSFQCGRIYTRRCKKWVFGWSDRNTRFSGRSELINELETQIASRNRARKAAIFGLGRTGKTQIALELAHRMRDRNPERSVFWILPTSLRTFEQALISLGQFLGLPGLTTRDAKAQVKAYLSSERAGSWLLIIDNADDPDMWGASGGSTSLEDYLPHSCYGFVLFTTRNKKLATQLVGPNVITLTELDDENATNPPRESLLQKNQADDIESHHRTATAIYDNKASEDNELDFPAGAKIVIVVCITASSLFHCLRPCISLPLPVGNVC